MEQIRAIDDTLSEQEITRIEGVVRESQAKIVELLLKHKAGYQENTQNIREWMAM